MGKLAEREVRDSKWLDLLGWLDNVHGNYDAQYLVSCSGFNVARDFRAALRSDRFVG